MANAVLYTLGSTSYVIALGILSEPARPWTDVWKASEATGLRDNPSNHSESPKQDG